MAYLKAILLRRRRNSSLSGAATPDGALITRGGDFILDRFGNYIVETR